MIYYKNNRNCFAESLEYDTFYLQVLQIVKDNWKRTGNELLGLSDSKVSRLLSGKQKDFKALVKMCEFMKLDFSFKLF
jgi:hypothetical protein